MLPTFIVIGAMKAGTTSLWSYLRGHPLVFMPQEKELDFFVAQRNWNRGRDWYASRFEDARSATAVGEASPNYTMASCFPGVPERMAGLIPEVKLIYVVRHPIERLISHYLHHVASGREDRPLERAFVENLDYFHTSRYAFQLERYLEKFDRSQILVITTEELREHRRATLQTVFRFLDVDAEWEPPDVDIERHRTADKTPAFRTERPSDSAVRLLARVAPAAARRWQRRRWAGVLDPAELSLPPDLERRAREALRPEVAFLRGFLGPGFDGWGLG